MDCAGQGLMTEGIDHGQRIRQAAHQRGRYWRKKFGLERRFGSTGAIS
jgi:hypothetical protein